MRFCHMLGVGLLLIATSTAAGGSSSRLALAFGGVPTRGTPTPPATSLHVPTASSIRQLVHDLATGSGDGGPISEPAPTPSPIPAVGGMPQSDTFSNGSFSAPFALSCAANATQPCPDAASSTTWSFSPNGGLQIVAQPGSLLGVANDARNLVLQPISPAADWIITTQLTLRTVPGSVAAGQMAGLMVYQDDDNFLLLGRTFTPTGAEIELLQETAGVDVVHSVPEAAGKGETVYLRLVKMGGSFQAIFSYDDVHTLPISWSTASGQISTVTAGYASPHVGLFAFGARKPRLAQPADFAWFQAVAQTPPVPPTPHLAIVSLRTYDGNHRSRALYVHHPVGFFVRYHLVAASVRTPGIAHFTVHAGARTLGSYQLPLLPRAAGNLSLHVNPLPHVGAGTLAVQLQLGAHVATATHAFAVFDPAGFRVRPVAEVSQIRVARVESNQQAEDEYYVIHPQNLSYAAEGRQTGFYESAELSWPSRDQSEAAMQADLVSIFGSPRQAQDAFATQVAMYQQMAAQQSKKVAIHALRLDGTMGDHDASFIATAHYGVSEVEIVFVRGQVLVQHWVYFAGVPPTDLLNTMMRAAEATSKGLDRLAWLQQS